MHPTARARRNLAVLRQRWPHLGERIQRAPQLTDCYRPTDTPEPTLVIDGVHLTSGYDRLAEARLQARLIGEEATEAWVYGAALGDLPRVLLERPALRQLHVVLLNPCVFKTTFPHVDHTDWLRDERVTLHLGAAFDDVHRPFAVAPACLHLADEDSARLRDLIRLELATPFLRKRHAQRIPWADRLQAIQPYVAADGDVQSLFGTHDGGLFLVVGNGPSLKDCLDLLRRLRDHAPVIAVLPAYPTLHEAGLLPDVVIAIDPETVVPSMDATSPRFDPPLVYFPAVPPAVLDRWSGLRMVAYPERPDHPFKALQARHPRGTLFSAGSDLHVAADLAVKMGAGRMLLVGADFALPTNAPARPDQLRRQPEHAAVPWVLNGFGSRVATSRAHQGALRDLERYVQAHPEICFLNASRNGAAIQGTTYFDEVSA